jgi:hypothetical protein
MLILCRYGEADRPPQGNTAGLEDVLHTLRQVSVSRELHVIFFCAFALLMFTSASIIPNSFFLS